METNKRCDGDEVSHRKWSPRDANTSLKVEHLKKMEGFYLSSTSYLLLAALVLIVLGLAGDKFIRRRKKKSEGPLGVSAPGPKPWPVIGSLHLLGGYEIPYQAFDNLSKKYGPVFSIKLGQEKCLVISNLEHTKEVLFSKGDHFDGRPNFTRYHELFGGDKQNSLAFCDWSDTQKTRRDMLKDHTFPKAFTERFKTLDILINEELHELCSMINEGTTAIKPLISQACANVFMSYFCSTRFNFDDEGFKKLIKNFDEVFYEVNQGYAADFLPWLVPFYIGNLRKLKKTGKEIKEFMIERVIQKRLESWVAGQDEDDYVDSLISHVQGSKATMSLDTALFALEDIVGGHSAVANFIVKILGFISQEPEVQENIQKEADTVLCGRDVTLSERNSMPYTEAVILESLRHIASPIVPHVANQSSTIAGYEIEKDTLIFLNNYTLNMSPELWTEPSKFNPERFLTAERKVLKPEHFLPFGGGRRSCMGYKMTQLISFVVVATLLQRFHIVPADNLKVPLGNLALPFETLQFRFHPR